MSSTVYNKCAIRYITQQHHMYKTEYQEYNCKQSQYIHKKEYVQSYILNIIIIKNYNAKQAFGREVSNSKYHRNAKDTNLN